MNTIFKLTETMMLKGIELPRVKLMQTTAARQVK